MYEWTETLYIIIPIAQRNNMAAIAEKIMPDVNEGAMFDSIRLSTKGVEPATHLMSVCPCEKGMAEQWRQILLQSSSKPRDYPDESTSTADKVIGSTVKLDSKAITILTDRIDQQRVKDTKLVRLIDDNHSALTAVTDIEDVLQRAGLVRIIPDEVG
jgi:hypothetical protein